MQTQPWHPFARVSPRKDVWFYLYWAVSLLLAPVLVPVRLFFIVLAMVLQKYTIQLLTRDLDVERPMHLVRRRVIHAVSAFYCRVFLFMFGCVWIREVNPQLRPDLERAYVLVSNHVSSLDPVFLICVGVSSFLSKEEVKRMPTFGIACWALQGIFVRRGTRSEETLRRIAERVAGDVQDEGRPRLYPPLCIFPEGTTVNQTALLQFKQGAFAPGKPVSMLSIEYDNRFCDRSDAGASMVRTQLRSLLGLYYTVRITYMGDYEPSAEEVADPALYAENVRRLYQRALGWRLSPYTFRDKYYFMRKPSYTYEGCSEQYRADFGPEVRSDNYAIRRAAVEEMLREERRAAKE